MTDEELKELRARNEARWAKCKELLGDRYLLHPSKPKAKWGIKQ